MTIFNFGFLSAAVFKISKTPSNPYGPLTLDCQEGERERERERKREREREREREKEKERERGSLLRHGLLPVKQLHLLLPSWE
jgi:hypothetical protein